MLKRCQRRASCLQLRTRRPQLGESRQSQLLLESFEICGQENKTRRLRLQFRCSLFLVGRLKVAPELSKVLQPLLLTGGQSRDAANVMLLCEAGQTIEQLTGLCARHHFRQRRQEGRRERLARVFKAFLYLAANRRELVEDVQVKRPEGNVGLVL